MGHSHHHSHGHGDHEQNTEMAVKRIRTAFFLNFAFTLVELVGGFLTGSVAILADAVHDLGDSISLGLAMYLQKKSGDKATAHVTYGFQRLSLLSAFISGIVLLFGSLLVMIESIPRLTEEHPPHAEGMLILAVLGVVVNGVAVIRLKMGSTQNEKILTLHLLEDVLGWTAVLIGSILIWIFQWAWLDPVLAIGISMYICWHSFSHLKETMGIFLQYVPDNVPLDEVRKKILDIDGIVALHGSHSWSLDGSSHVYTSQLELRSKDEDADKIKAKVRLLLKDMGFRHITLEVVYGEADLCH